MIVYIAKNLIEDNIIKKLIIFKSNLPIQSRTVNTKLIYALEAYFAKEAQVISIGATTDQEQCRKAQEMAIKELTPVYEALDSATLELMEVNIVS